MSWAMAEVYEAVTDRVLVNLAKYFPYISKSSEVRDLYEYQARMLAQLGQVNRETADIITRRRRLPICSPYTAKRVGSTTLPSVCAGI